MEHILNVPPAVGLNILQIGKKNRRPSNSEHMKVYKNPFVRRNTN